MHIDPRFHKSKVSMIEPDSFSVSHTEFPANLPEPITLFFRAKDDCHFEMHLSYAEAHYIAQRLLSALKEKTQESPKQNDM